MKHLVLTTTLLALPVPALAEDVVIEAGQFFMTHRDYDHETNTYADTPPKGEETACFQITKVDLAGEEIDVVLVSGIYDPWWSETAYEVGFEDAYVPAIGFMENNPGADWTELLHNIWKTVPSCPPP